MTARVDATRAAPAELERLRTRHGPLVLMQSGGCCDGSSPASFPEGELMLGPNDLLLGPIDGVPFYIDSEQYERWGRPRLTLDVGSGEGSGFSLEGLDGLHFACRTFA